MIRRYERGLFQQARPTADLTIDTKTREIQQSIARKLALNLRHRTHFAGFAHAFAKRGHDARHGFHQPRLFRDPTAGVRRLQAAGPVVEVRFPIIGRVWTPTTQEMASRVLKESQVFTLRKDDGAVAGLRWWMPRIFRVFANNMLTVDEPDHTRLRGIVDEAFRRRAVHDMEPRIRVIADELAGDLFAQGSPADLVSRYARMLPLSVICELLGLPLADRPKFMAWAGRATGVSSTLGFFRLVPTIAALMGRPSRAFALQDVKSCGGLRSTRNPSHVTQIRIIPY
jgi:cytochrome P450